MEKCNDHGLTPAEAGQNKIKSFLFLLFCVIIKLMNNPLNPPLQGGLNIKVNSGAKSARFVVDLKKDLPVKTSDVQGDIGCPESRLEKMAELDYGKMIKKGKVRGGVLINDLGGAINKFWIPSPLSRGLKAAGMTNKKAGIKKNKIPLPPLLKGVNQLAFVEFGKLLYAGFYKICYGAGWVIMFIVRLGYLIGAAVIRKFRIPACAGMTRMGRSLAMTERKKERKVEKEEIVITNKIPLTPFAKGGLKPILVFAGALLIIILPVKAFTFYKSLDSVKGRVLGASASAMSDLLAGGQSAANFDFSQADKNFTQAGENFLTAQNQLADINGLILALAALAPDKNVRLAAAGKHILKAGELSAEAGKNLSLALFGLTGWQEKTPSVLRTLGVQSQLAADNLKGLAAELNQIDSGLIPSEYQKNFILLKQKVFELNSGLNQFIGLADTLAIFLGAEQDKRYLLVFQNNSELRASGGFIGSYAIMDFSQGRIKNISAPGGGSYDTDAGLLKKIKSPEPLRLVRPDWHFWDANWWPDWPTSARKLAWFYENSGGSTVDGVISLTPTVMERLLKVIGPIDMKEQYGIIFDADNFWLETQKLSEQKPDVTKQPKKIIGDLMSAIISELPKRLGQGNLLELLKAGQESLDDKNILFYFTDSELQSQAAELGWAGKIKDAAGDYLSVVNTNIAGQKSDRKINQQISHLAEVQADGAIIDTLTVRRTHTGAKGEPFSGARNVNWMRIYVPAGSELLSAEGFKPLDQIFFKPAESGWLDDPDVAAGQNSERTDEATKTLIYSESGKTVFANWSQLDPGESVEINIKYRLPFRLDGGQGKLCSYSLLAQKQPGMNSSSLASALKLSHNFKAVWQDNLPLNEAFDGDKIMAAVMEEK
ncbi:MAG: DUF4012 domain-containing protein [bacterium]|nr:DUF4012 domain-containing protein [bacterium]